jgi:hypothetical protein
MQLDHLLALSDHNLIETSREWTRRIVGGVVHEDEGLIHGRCVAERPSRGTRDAVGRASSAARYRGRWLTGTDGGSER